MNYISIQYLRAIAIILVFLVHLSIQESKLFHDPIIGIFKVGTAGVDIFFTISGFIMMLLIERKKEKNFLLKRVIRIYPIYWIYLSAVMLLILINPSFVNSSTDASYVRSILLLPSSTTPLLNVSWTLVYEMYFYLLISFIVYFFNTNKYIYINILIILSVLLGLYIGQNRYSYPEVKLITSPMLLEFLFGMFIYYLLNRRSQVLKYGVYFLFISTIIFISYHYNEIYFADIDFFGTDIYDNRVVYFGIPSFFLVLGLVALEYKKTLLKVNILKFIGDISYSLYLSHYFVLVLVYKVFEKFVHIESYIINIVFIILSIVISFIVGAFSYIYIEKRLIQYLNKKLRKC